MKKYKSYYYTTKLCGFKERNNIAPIRLYSWAIRNKEGETLQSSITEFESKEDAEINAQENIDEYYY